MHIKAPAIVCGVRPHGEAGAIVRLFTEKEGLLGAYVAGGRGRHMRPIFIPGNMVLAELRARSGSTLLSGRAELVESRGAWLTEPLLASALLWVTSLTARTLPEGQPFPALYEALSALLQAICHAPSARGWAIALAGYEALLLRELGYRHMHSRPSPEDWGAVLDVLDVLGRDIERYPLAQRSGDVMAARMVLLERLKRIER